SESWQDGQRWPLMLPISIQNQSASVASGVGIFEPSTDVLSRWLLNQQGFSCVGLLSTKLMFSYVVSLSGRTASRRQTAMKRVPWAFWNCPIRVNGAHCVEFA